MPLFLSTASGGGAGGSGPPPPPSSVPEAVQLHAGVLVDFASRRAVDLGGGSGGPPAAGAGADAAASSKDGGDAVGSRRHAALSYQAVRTRGDSGADNSGDRDGGGPDLGVWDCRVRPPSSSASAALLRRVVVDRRAGPVGPAGGDGDGEGEAADEGEGPAEKTEAGGIGTRSVPILATVDLSDPTLVQPALEAMRSAVVEVYADTARSAAPRRDRPNCTTSLKSLERATFGSAKVVEEVGPGSGGGRRIALIVAAIVPPPSDGAQSAQDEYVERQSRSLVLYHLSKFALETDCTLCFVSAGEDNLEDAEGGGTAEGRDTAMSVDDLGRLVRRVALGLPPVEQDENAGPADGGGSDGSPGMTPSVHIPGSHDGEVVRGALLRNASCEGRWDASSDDLAGALPPSAIPRPSSGGDESDNGATEAAEGGGGSGDDAWLSRLADTVGVGPEPTATPKRIASAPSSGNSVAPSSRAGGRAAAAAPGGGGGKVPAKKRGERVRAAKAKDGKPKDEKEVMNFFDSLLKK